jgi:hypothetical protein
MGTTKFKNNELTLMKRLFIISILIVIFFRLFQTYTNLNGIRNDEIALIQFDSRPLKGYWKTAAEWNNYYAHLHNHSYIYYTNNKRCYHGSEPLASPWCKVLAMMQADIDFPKIKIFIYMDSDAVINKRYIDKPLNEFLVIMQENLSWDPEKRPLVFNQDGKCWWCALVERVGYTMCLNAGTVLWYRHPVSAKLLTDWWDASMDPELEGNPIRRYILIVFLLGLFLIIIVKEISTEMAVGAR